LAAEQLAAEQLAAEQRRNVPAATDDDSREHAPTRDRQSEPPVILWRNDPRRGRMVVACCPRARQIGVRIGLPIAQATEWVRSANRRGILPSNAADRQPLANDAATENDLAKSAVLVAEHDPVADSIALQRVATWIQKHISPLVAIETLGKRLWAGQALRQADTLLCDLSGVTHLFEDEPGILAATHRCLRACGLNAKLAIADNAAAAWAHAHYNRQADFISRSLADDLQPLSVNALRIEPEVKHTLDRLGIETIGALLKLPRSGLARRLGPSLVDRIAEVLGEIDVPLDAHHAQARCQAKHALEYPTDDFEILADRFQRLTAEIVTSLATTQRGALRLACRLELTDRSRLETFVGLFAPTLDEKHLAGLVQSAVESLSPSAPVTQLTLTVTQSGPLRTTQSSLFGDQAGDIEDHSAIDTSLARLIDGLSGRLGREAVLGVRSADNPLPEKAYRTYSLTDHQTRRALRRLQTGTIKTRRSAEASRDTPHRQFHLPGRHDPRRRPMKLLRRPVRLEVVRQSDAAQTAASFGADTLPQFRYAGGVYRIVRSFGPERIETGWWHGPTTRRDYYKVQTDRGDIWWIYQDLKSTDDWYLHGRFM
jgi:protein ImuB